jgi:hypothetical protein
MQRKLLAATVAAGPLLALAFAAAPQIVRAQTPVEITTATTTPVATATARAGAPADVSVTGAGSITLTTAGPLITLNSNNSVSVAGGLSTSGISGSTGILALGGNAGGVTLSSSISLTSPLNPPDNDNDGDADGPLADGSGRYGIRVLGPGNFTGNISNNVGGAILISGNDSAGISVETGLIGNLLQAGTMNTTGDRAFGVRVAAPVTGNVTIQGSTSTFGADAVAVAIDGAVSGVVRIQGAVVGTGFRYQTRPFLSSDRARLDADDLLPGGPVVRVTASARGGVIFDAPPFVDTSNQTDANNDGVLDYLVVDSDGDGVIDVAESVANVTAYGAAPAVLVGSASQAITLGAVGAGADAFGLINKGSITTDGLFDGFSSTGIQIGGGGGLATMLTNGFNNTGSISANAYVADATAVRLLSGASAPSIVNSGIMTAAVTSEGVHTARALTIQSGATVTSLNNAGSIVATMTGANGTAIAIEDLNGSLTRLDNTRVITGAVINNSSNPATGRSIAIDARANTAGLTIVQNGTPSATSLLDTDGDRVNDVDEPIIFGDVLLGSGSDRVELNNGSLTGALAFGAGADALVIGSTVSVNTALSDSDGALSISVGAGSLAISNAETINATSLNANSADSQLLFAADPVKGASTRLVLATASIANNARVGMTLNSILDTPTRYTVIDAGSLTVGSLRSSLTGSPFLYVSSASANAAAGEVYIDIRPRTAGELGFNQTQSQGYNAIIQALKTDTALAAPLLVQTDRDGLVRLYDQLLPDLGRGVFDALVYANEQLTQGISIRPDLFERYGPDSFWIQEVNSLVRTETDGTMGSDTQVFGFAGGHEAMGEYGGALGLAVAYLNVQERDNAAQVGEQTTASFVQADVYWRRAIGGWRMLVGAGGGYGWLDGDRRFFSGDLNGDGENDLARENSAKWNALIGHAFSSLGYEAELGRFFARPEARVDYLYVRESERAESGGGSGFDLTTGKRSSSALTAMGSMTFGATFGQDLWWRPELRVGYRQQVAGSVGDTVARFNGGSAFTLASADEKEGAITLDMALRAGTPMSYVAVEGGVAAAKRQKRYNLRLAGRMMF